mmetsp:Transcript_53880/g.100953  ORF Transcript_53880/g.100953 Transcript_53880/m.100953 type:complete len:277 (-) Transcript_53880:897-1727(-)
MEHAIWLLLIMLSCVSQMQGCTARSAWKRLKSALSWQDLHYLQQACSSRKFWRSLTAPDRIPHGIILLAVERSFLPADTLAFAFALVSGATPPSSFVSTVPGIFALPSAFVLRGIRPRTKDGLSLASTQPVVHILPLRVIVRKLFPGVELVDPLASQASCCNPVAPVGTRVIVQQVLFKMGRTVAPVHTKIEDQKTCHILPSSIAHEACGTELKHVGIDQLVSRLPLFPPLQLVTGTFPWRPVPSDSSWYKDFVSLTPSHVDEEVSPGQFKNEPVG